MGEVLEVIDQREKRRFTASIASHQSTNDQMNWIENTYGNDEDSYTFLYV